MVVDGVELFRMIRDGEIEENISIKELNNDLIITLKNDVLYYYNSRTEEECELFEDYDLSILKCKFKIELKNKILKQEEKEEEEIDINKDLIIGVNEQGNEYLEYKNDGLTASGYSRNYSKYDILIVKAIKQFDKKIK